MSADAALLALLAELSELEYQTRRTELAQTAGIGVGALDAVRRDARRAARAKHASRDAGEPWPTPVDGEQLAAGVDAALRRFVVLAESAYVLVTMWVIGTHAYAARHVWPLLLARSPQPACGKSTLLDALERLVARAFAAGNASLATLFRAAANGPTQLLDELDRWLERDPEVVGFLCAGWQSGRPFVRCHPETHELQEFTCYTPKALALIGDVQDEALRSRCIVVEMRRALPGERAERFRAARPYPELAELRSMAMRWAADHAGIVGAYELGDEELPGLSGRAADNAEALLSVADAIGGEWPERCREALLGAPADESNDLGAMLLADLSTLLETLDESADAVSTQRVLDHLLRPEAEDRPWKTLGKNGLEANGLRRRLAPFGCRPGRHSIAGTQQRGYLVAPIREAIGRYLTAPTPAIPDPSREPSRGVYPSSAGAPSAQESAGEGPSRRLDGSDTCSGGPGTRGVRGRIAPLAVGCPAWSAWRERVCALVDHGADVADAEIQAADELGHLVRERVQ